MPSFYRRCSWKITQLFFFFFKDVEPPQIECPDNLTTVTEEGLPYASLIFSLPKTTDNSGKPPTIWSKPPFEKNSVLKFNIGKTIVEIYSVDDSGNYAHCSFAVNVKGNIIMIMNIKRDVLIKRFLLEILLFPQTKKLQKFLNASLHLLFTSATFQRTHQTSFGKNPFSTITQEFHSLSWRHLLFLISL